MTASPARAAEAVENLADFRGGIAAANTHSQHSKGYAHAMLAAGMFASAAGAGALAAVPLLAGAIGTNLQDLRDSTL